MKKSWFYIPAVLVGIGIGGLGVMQVMAQRSTDVNGNGSTATTTGWGMMQSFSGRSAAIEQTLSQQQSESMMKQSLQHATVDKSQNSIAYTGRDVTVVFFAGPEDADGKFVVGDLVNPTIHIEKGAHVVFKVINMDSGMPHGIEITNSNPPYSYMSMMQGGIYSGSFIPPLPQAQQGTYPVASAAFTANHSGTFHYLCQVPGHAAKGMFGEITID